MMLDLFYLNPWQWRRLFTHEDSKFYHAHKLLGVGVLLHFFYRMGVFWVYGNMGFDGSYTTLFWILVHAALHVTSFQFIIPSRRNKTYNIIWPEMRFHTMIFAYRSIVTWFMMWMAMRGWIGLEIEHYARPLIVFATMGAADYVTYYYKHIEEKVDKEDSTMRGNPYPSYVPGWYVKVHNYFYSVSQVFATIHILNSTIMDTVFLLLLAIQTAPFCMTLVKKGILKQGGWHLYYTLALLSNYVYIAIHPDYEGFFPYNSVFAFYFVVSRFVYGVNKYAIWGMISLCLLPFYGQKLI